MALRKCEASGSRRTASADLLLCRARLSLVSLFGQVQTHGPQIIGRQPQVDFCRCRAAVPEQIANRFERNLGAHETSRTRKPECMGAMPTFHLNTRLSEAA